MSEYRWTGNHAVEVSVGDVKQMVGIGDFVTLGTHDLENVDNKVLLEQGLVEVQRQEVIIPPEPEPEPEKTTAKKGGETKNAKAGDAGKST